MKPLSVRKAAGLWLAEMAQDWSRYVDPHEDQEHGLDLEERSGLWQLVARFFPLVSADGCIEVHFVACRFLSCTLESPAICRRRGQSFVMPMRVVFRVVVFEPEDEHGKRHICNVLEQEVYVCDLPMLTKEGTFVIDGEDMVCVPEVLACADPKRQRAAQDVDSVRLRTPGALLLAHLEEGLHRVVKTTLNRLAKAERSGHEPMPHRLFSFRPLHTRLRRWVRVTMEPFEPANPVAALAHLLKVRRPGTKPPDTTLPIGTGIMPDGTLLLGQDSPALPRWAVEALPLLEADGPPVSEISGVQGSVWSPCDGVVSAVCDGVLVVTPPLMSEPERLCWPEVVPFFSGSGATRHAPRVLVEPGQAVVKGQALASGYPTQALACGRDVKVAVVTAGVLSRWLPEASAGVYLNPDGDVAQRFTSSHIHTIYYTLKKAQRPEGDLVVGAGLSPGETTRLDEYGVVVEGACVEAGDVLVSMANGEHLRVPQWLERAQVGSAWFFGADTRRTQSCAGRQRDIERFDEGTNALVKAAGGSLRGVFKRHFAGGKLIRSMGYEAGADGWVTLPVGTPVTEGFIDALPMGALVDLAESTSTDFDLLDGLHILMDKYNGFIDARFFERGCWASAVSLPRGVLQIGAINLHYTQALRPGDELLAACEARAVVNGGFDESGVRAFCRILGQQPELVWVVDEMPQWASEAGLEVIEAGDAGRLSGVWVGSLYMVKTPGRQAL